MSNEEIDKKTRCDSPQQQQQQNSEGQSQPQQESKESKEKSHHHYDRSSSRRMSHFKDYKFFRSFSAKVENWPMRKAEAFWRRMREKKIAGLFYRIYFHFLDFFWQHLQ